MAEVLPNRAGSDSTGLTSVILSAVESVGALSPDRDFSGMNTHFLMEHLQAHGGPGAVEKVLAGAGDARPAEKLLDLLGARRPGPPALRLAPGHGGRGGLPDGGRPRLSLSLSLGDDR
jgi:hypothetical protein